MVMAEAQSQFDVAAGYVYVLSCPEEPDTIKIGASPTDPGAYLNEPFGTSYPIPCKVEFAVHVPDRLELEKSLLLKLAPRRLPRDANRFAASVDEAVAAAVQLVGSDYTNARITGVIFRKQVALLKKMEADFRSRNKTFSILNGELADMQKTVRQCRGELGEKTRLIERQAAEIEQLRGEGAALTGKWRKARIAGFAAGGIAILAAALAAMSLTVSA